MQVLPFGIISFQNPNESYREFAIFQSHPNDPLPLIPLITALIIFNSYDLTPVSVYYRTTNDTVILDRIVNITTGFNQNFSDYQPSIAIIVTWEDYSQPMQVSIFIA